MKFYDILQSEIQDTVKPESLDSTLPNYKEIDVKSGALMKSFNDTIKSNDIVYDSEGEALPKRKTSLPSSIPKGDPSKRIKLTEVDVNDVEGIRKAWGGGMLSKLTIPILNAFCKSVGIKNGKKKDDTLIAIDTYFGNH